MDFAPTIHYSSTPSILLHSKGGVKNQFNMEECKAKYKPASLSTLWPPPPTLNRLLAFYKYF